MHSFIKRLFVGAGLVASLTMTAACSLAQTGRYDPAEGRQQPNVIPATARAVPGRDIQIAAQDAGLLKELIAVRGSRVKKGQVLARLNDDQPQMSLKIADAKLQKAEKEETNDVPIRYARETEKVNASKLKKAEEINQRAPGAIPEAEVETLRLTVSQAKLQVENAEKNKFLAGFEVAVQKAEVQAANNAIEERKVKAEFDGMVEEVYLYPGQWVELGRPILRLTSLVEMVVEGDVEASAYDPQDVAGKEVTVEVTLARGRKESLPGKIVYVSNRLVSGGTQGRYHVMAKVKNRQEGGFWLLRPGMLPMMTIHVD